MKRLMLIALSTFALGAITSTANAEVVIKLGTLAPDGSPWHNQLRELAEKFAQASNGEVKVKIYPGGVLGNESDMIRKLRVNQLQAALLTGPGIRDIEPAVQSVQVPMLLRSNEELDYVLQKMAPKFDKLLDDKGFVVLFWGSAGWVTFFTQQEVKTPAPMKDIPVFAWTGDDGAVEAWKIAGFKPVPISATDITQSLQTGMIKAVDTTPLAALSFGWHRHAKYMTDVRWAPLVGSLFISKKSWEKIPADLRPKLQQIARDVGVQVREAGRKLEQDAIATMKKDGMTFVAISQSEKEQWEAAAAKAWPFIREKVVPTAVFDEVKKHRDDFAAQKK